MAFLEHTVVKNLHELMKRHKPKEFKDVYSLLEPQHWIYVCLLEITKNSPALAV